MWPRGRRVLWSDRAGFVAGEALVLAPAAPSPRAPPPGPQNCQRFFSESPCRPLSISSAGIQSTGPPPKARVLQRAFPMNSVCTCF